MEGFIKKKIGGEVRGFKFDLKSVGLILREIDAPLEKLSENMKNNFLFVYPIILFQGHKRYEEKQGNILTDPDQVYDWIENEGKGLLSENVLEVVSYFSSTLVSLFPSEDKGPNEKGKSKK